MTQPVLSVVAASRNDDHGGDPLVRTQHFLNGIALLAERHHVPVEIILVDWNPVPGRPGLAGVLQLPAGTTWCTGRVITVPAALHRRFKYSESLGFFQMIAKNAGLRRARGRHLLATNIDIIFSEELFLAMTGDALRPDRHYRVDRLDVPANLAPGAGLPEMTAHVWGAPIRAHRRFAPPEFAQRLYPHGLDQPRSCELTVLESAPLPAGLRATTVAGQPALEVGPDAPPSFLHTNACGDFALMSSEAWHTLHGYPEFEAFSFNIDSIGLMQAHYGGFHEVSLLPPRAAFHLEHSLGSGWTPEGEKVLFDRLEQKQILNPEWRLLDALVARLRAHQGPLLMNGPHWGLAAFDLPEEPLLPGRSHESPPHPRPEPEWPGYPVSAILPEFDLDRLSLWEERRLRRRRRYTTSAEECDREHILQFFWPDATGAHSEERVAEFAHTLPGRTRLHVFIPESFPGAILRFDPTFHPGLIELHQCEISSAVTGRRLWQLSPEGAPIGLWGTARGLPTPADRAEFRFLATGDDPQIYLPPLPPGTHGPLHVMVELSYSPVAAPVL